MLIIFGSINLDISVPAARIPTAGETLLGGVALISPGGKGANQAHAAQCFGMPTRLYGTVGSDAFAVPALAQLQQAGVDLHGVAVSGALPTGLALITVGADGDNAIVVAPGANADSCASQVPDEALRAARALLLQLEVPVAQSAALAARARALGASVILNASPLPDCGVGDLSFADTLIVNRLELRQLARESGVEGDQPQVLAGRLAEAHKVEVLVTLGAGGALLVSPGGGLVESRALPVAALDSTGAGDTFAGVFAAAIAAGLPKQGAMDTASAAAGLACTKSGAQLAQPGRQEILAAVARLHQDNSPRTFQ